jgi:hypothetical protein
MTEVIEYGVTQPGQRDSRTNKELFTSLHGETVALGPRGVLVVFGVLFSSTGVLLARGVRWLYRKARGHA